MTGGATLSYSQCKKQEKGGKKYAAAGDQTRVSLVWLCFGNHWARQAVLIGKGASAPFR